MIRHEVFLPTIKVDDVHHNSMYKHELNLAKDFVSKIAQPTNIKTCPISGMERHEVLFEKWGQRYAMCPKTWSLSIGTMPDDKIMNQYWFDSDLSRYRGTAEFQNASTELRKELWTSQVEWIEGRVRRYLGMDKYSVVDWGPRMQGWVDIVKDTNFIKDYSIAESLPPVEPTFKKENYQAVLMFDVIQRYSRPLELLLKVFNSLVSGGILLLACRSGSGFDVLTLGGESESIFPLDHVCLPSPQGMAMLLKSAGFEILELTTPGLLDVQLVKKSLDQIPKNRYFQRYVTSLDDLTLERLQGFLQQNNLSSHIRVVAKKPG